MNQAQRNHIIKNISELVNCTRSETEWYERLLGHGFLSEPVWETIKNTETNTHSRVRQLYFQCQKTPNYPLLIQSLKECQNIDAAAILENLESVLPSPASAVGGVEYDKRAVDVVDNHVNTTKINDELFSSAFVKNYKIIESLGHGAYGIVYKCTRKDSPEKIVAIKLIKFKSGTEKVEREVQVMKELKHQNIVRFSNYWLENPREGYKYIDTPPIDITNEGVLFIEMEFCDKGNLSAWFKNPKRNNAQGKQIIYQITKGIYYLHEQIVTHRDIKPENIMLCVQPSSNLVVVKICDFGISREIGVKMTTNIGTEYYKAPEVKTGKYDAKADMYSLGVVTFAIITLGNDSQTKKLESEIKNVETNVFINSIISTNGFHFTDAANSFMANASLEKEKSLITRLTELDPTRRPHAMRVMIDLHEMYPNIDTLSIPITDL